MWDKANKSSPDVGAKFDSWAASGRRHGSITVESGFDSLNFRIWDDSPANKITRAQRRAEFGQVQALAATSASTPVLHLSADTRTSPGLASTPSSRDGAGGNRDDSLDFVVDWR